jgi:hypothetical protein
VQLDAAEHPALRAIGMTRTQLVAAALVHASLIGAGGAVLAAALAAALSPLAPVGLARQAEIDPGWSIDPLVLGFGVPAVLLLVLARAALAAWWASRTPGGAGAWQRAPERPSPAAVRLAQAGVGMALDSGRGPTAAPVRSALVGATVAVLAITASLTFAASLDRLVRSPVLQGWNWDVLVGSPHDGTDISASARRVLAANPLIGGYSSIATGNQSIRVGTLDTAAVGLDPLRGAVLPRFFAGRQAQTANEIVLGRTTLRRLGKHLGDVVEVQAPGGQRSMRIVGEALLSPAAFGSTTPPTMGSGAVLTVAGLRALEPDVATNLLLVTYAPGANEEEAFRSLQRDFGHRVLRPLPVDAVANVQRVSGLPLALAALLAVLGAATLGHTLAISTRRRRRDLAVLKTLGFVRRQVWATLAWQATTMAVVALLVGLPLGVAAGRWAWMLVAEGLESPAGPVIPALALLLAVPAAVLVANLTAALPARAAAGTRPAVVLRSE